MKKALLGVEFLLTRWHFFYNVHSNESPTAEYLFVMERAGCLPLISLKSRTHKDLDMLILLSSDKESGCNYEGKCPRQKLCVLGALFRYLLFSFEKTMRKLSTATDLLEDVLLSYNENKY